MSSYMKQAFYIFAVTVMTLWSSGCSSSGDGDSSGGDSSVDDTIPTLPPTSAVLGSATAQNGLNAAQVLFNVQGYVFAAPARLSAMQAAISPLGALPPLDTVVGCAYGGTMIHAGYFGETSHDVTTTYTDCEIYPGTIYKSGSIREIALYPEGNTTNLREIYMTDVLMEIDGVNSKVYAGSQIELRDILSDSGTVEFSMQTETAGEIERLENVVQKLGFGSSGDPSLCYAAGNVYVDNNLSYYLQISTEYDPLCTDPFTHDFSRTTLFSGSMELVGSDGNVSMHVTSDNNITIEGIDGSVIITVN